MKKLSFSFLVLILSFVSIYAQNVQTIRGKIIDAQTEMPIIGATIVLLDSEPLIGTVSDVDGNFRLDNVTLGRQGITVSFIGYNPAVIRNLMLVKGKETVLDIRMDERINQIQNVVITAKNNKANVNNEMATVSARTFSIEETERYAGSLGDPSRMAANFAGVSAPSDQRNDIIIRGNSPMGLLWRLDGIDIPNPNHFGSLGSTGGPVSMLNNNLLSNSDFFTGAFPAEYGNAISGAFDLRMRNGNNQKYEFLGQVGFNGFEFGAEGPISKKTGASFIINARYSTLEVMSKLGMSMGTGASVPQYKDLTFKINLPKGKFGKLSIFGMGGLSYIEMLESEEDNAQFGFGGSDLRYGSDMGVVGLNHTLFFNNTTRMITRLSVLATKITTKVDSLDQNSDYDFLYYNSTTTEVIYTGAVELHKKFNAKNYLKLGVKYKLSNIDYSDSVYLWDRDEYYKQYDLNEYLSTFQGFVQHQHKFTDNIVANIGLYGNFMLLNEKFVVEPRAGIKWNFTPKQSISLGVGMHSQQQMTGIYFLRDSFDVFTNHNLDFTKAIHGVLAYDFLITKNLRVKFETYYQYIYNVPVVDLQPEFSMLNLGDDFTAFAYDYMVNKGTGTNYGIELTVEKFFSEGFYFLLTTSLYESKYEGYDGIERNSKFNGNFVYNALGGYEFRLGDYSTLALDLKGVYAGGKRYLPIDVNASIAANREEHDWSHIYDNKYDDYLRVNARITFKLSSKKFGMSQEWGADLQGINHWFSDRKNVYSQTWDKNKKEIITNYQEVMPFMMTYRILF